MSKTPTIVVPNVDDELERSLDYAAAKARELILLRAFPAGGQAARSVSGRAAPALSEDYRLHKVAKGRHGVSDQRFTSRTASAMGVIRSSPGERVVGFRERQEIAAALHERNAYFGLSDDEKHRALDRLRTFGAGLSRRVRIKNPVIVVEVLV